MAPTDRADVRVPVSVGELLDKITILEIKRERVTNSGSRQNVMTELALLRAIARPILDAHRELAPIVEALAGVNRDLWDIEDRIRACERRQTFDATFIALARLVYKRNDERARLKKSINIAANSSLIEEKAYAPY